MTVTAVVPTMTTDQPSATRDFYVRILGLRIIDERDGLVRLGTPGNGSAALNIAARDPAAEHPANPEFTIEVDDIDVVHQALRAHGHTPTADDAPRPGAGRGLLLTDPGGGRVEVRERSTGTPADLAHLTDLAAPFAIRVAASLRIADHIAAGVTEPAALAAETGTDPDALARLLRYLACRGVFRQDEPDRFTLANPGRLLVAAHPTRAQAWFDLTGIGGRMDLAYTALLESVRTGRAGYPLVSERTFWEDIAADPRLAASFDHLMEGWAGRWVPAVVSHYDWPPGGHVMDVGGGTGTLVTELARARPDLTATLLDVAGPADVAARRFTDAGIGERCRAVTGDFFDPLPSGADVYVLAQVLHDWDDLRATTILRSCARAAGDRGRVLIVERVAAEHDEVAFTGMDLRMLVLFGARERAPHELRALTAAAGLRVCSTVDSGWGLTLLECRPDDAGAAMPG